MWVLTGRVDLVKIPRSGSDPPAGTKAAVAFSPLVQHHTWAERKHSPSLDVRRCSPPLRTTWSAGPAVRHRPVRLRWARSDRCQGFRSGVAPERRRPTKDHV